jgi:hypothetical protein
MADSSIRLDRTNVFTDILDKREGYRGGLDPDSAECFHADASMADELDTQIAAAEARGRRVLADEPRATAARYEPATGRVHVELANGCGFAFPARKVQGLEAAGDDALADVEVLGRGIGLHWEALDVDVSVPGLLAGLFGTKAWMDRRRATRVGAVRSPAKADAARRNGAKGGRPRKNTAGGA